MMKPLIKLAYREIKYRKIHTAVYILVIACVTLLILVSTCVGESYYDNFRQMETNLRGTEADGYIRNLNVYSQEKLSEIDCIESIGIQEFIGMVETSKKEIIAITVYDYNEWEQHIKTSISNFEGTFPQKQNEIMTSRNVLRALGIRSPKIGQKINLQYKDAQGIEQQEQCELCGIFDDFIDNPLRTMDTFSGNILAAGLYSKEHDLQLPMGNIIFPALEENRYKNNCNNVVTFKINNAENTYELGAQKIANELNLIVNEDIVMLNNGNPEEGKWSGWIIAVVLCSIIGICGFLCIYNIAYIDVEKESSTLGKYRLLGASKRDLRKILYAKAFFVSCFGIPIGVLGGRLLALKIVPQIMTNLLSGSGYESLMPNDVRMSMETITITCIIVTGIVVVSFLAPARRVAQVSPIENFKGNIGTNKRKIRKTINGKMYRFAWRNVFQNKKQTFITLSSMSLGLTLFVAINTILSAPDWNRFLNIECPNDFMFFDVSLGEIQDPSQAQFDQKFMEEISQIEGVQQMEVTTSLEVNIDKSQISSIWNQYIIDKEEKEGENIGNNAIAQAVTFSEERLKTFSKVNSEFSEEELEEFNLGNVVFLRATEMLNYPENIIGEKICIENKFDNTEVEYIIGGVLEEPVNVENSDERPSNFGVMRYNPNSQYCITNIYMSNAGMKKLIDTPIIHEIRINTSEGMDSYVKIELEELKGNSYDKQLICRSDLINTYKPILEGFEGIGLVFSCILIGIGLLNFINSIVVSIISRKHEFAILESIGQTKKQLLMLMIYEGLIYGGITILLVSSVGMIFTRFLEHTLEKQLYYFNFEYPFDTICMLFTLIIFLCAVIPIIAYKSINKKNIVENLRADIY